MWNVTYKNNIYYENERVKRNINYHSTDKPLSQILKPKKIEIILSDMGDETT